MIEKIKNLFKKEVKEEITEEQPFSEKLIEVGNEIKKCDHILNGIKDLSSNDICFRDGSEFIVSYFIEKLDKELQQLLVPVIETYYNEKRKALIEEASKLF